MMYLRERAEGYKSKHQCNQRYTKASICDEAQCKFVSALKGNQNDFKTPHDKQIADI